MPPEEPPAQDVEDELRFYRVDTTGMNEARMREVHRYDGSGAGDTASPLTGRALRSGITSDASAKYIPYRAEAGTRVAVLRAVGLAVLVGTTISILGQLSLAGAAYVASAVSLSTQCSPPYPRRARACTAHSCAQRFGAWLDAIFFALATPFGNEQHAAAAAGQMRKEYGDAAREAVVHVGACIGAVIGAWLGARPPAAPSSIPPAGPPPRTRPQPHALRSVPSGPRHDHGPPATGVGQRPVLGGGGRHSGRLSGG